MTNDTLDEDFKTWLEQGRRLRTRFTLVRCAVAKEIAAIDAMLNQIRVVEEE